MNINQEKEFILELEALTRKYKISIQGCGCCDSPFLNELENVNLNPESGYAFIPELRWISKADNYD